MPARSAFPQPGNAHSQLIQASTPPDSNIATRRACKEPGPKHPVYTRNHE